MNPKEDPSDRLVDSLLREQNRHSADEELLREIDAKLEAAPISPSSRSARRNIGGLVQAAAAVLVASVGLTFLVLPRPPRPDNSPAKLHVTAESHLFPVPDDSVSPPVAANPVMAPAGDMASFEVGPAAPAVASPAGVPGSEGYSSLAAKEQIRRQRIPIPAGSARGTSSMRVDKDRLAGLDGENYRNLEEQILATDAMVPRREFVPPAGDFALSAAPRPSRENYGRLTDQPWKSPWSDALSTFSIDVDSASYTNVRRMILDGRPIPADAVRIEECINYFDYYYAGPEGDGPFAVHGNLATCPWKPRHLLARVAIKGREVDARSRPASNLVFLIDVSGSMQSPDKLPLLKRSMRVLLDQLDERDHLGMVVYAGSEGVVLDPTALDERGLSKAVQALGKLEAGGSTNGGAGIKRAYQMASAHIVPGGVNRVILATDGDFNVGTTGQGDLVKLVKQGAASGVSLSVLGFGTGNLNDAMMEAITNDGNGNYFYIDGDREANRVFQQKLTGTLVTIAKDVKIQVEFNPGKVQAYRLIGYANRILRDQDFADDKVDAGDIGAGHTVTAFYEIVPVGLPAPDTGSVDALRYQRPAGRETVASDDWFTLKLRYKHPEGEVSSLVETPVRGEPVAWEDAGNDFRFAAAVALFGMKLREMPGMADLPWPKVVEIARPALAEDPEEQRTGFVELVKKIAPEPREIDAVLTSDPSRGSAGPGSGNGRHPVSSEPEERSPIGQGILARGVVLMAGETPGPEVYAHGAGEVAGKPGTRLQVGSAFNLQHRALPFAGGPVVFTSSSDASSINDPSSILATGQLPKDARTCTFVFLPSGGKEDEPPYRTMAIDDSVQMFPPGSIMIVNLAADSVRFELEKDLHLIPSGSREVIANPPVGQNNMTRVTAAELHEGQWRLVYSSVWNGVGGDRMIQIIHRGPGGRFQLKGYLEEIAR
ncbi:vWA domain-containing protein [Luteolibacter marinus]|uniref:vWA domain-containing protein n=1 Tax=Luteolibacter marinus TaxID=2776705 RepID=UPI001869417D|nr:VWA domain-containing protein [Luteolibacter marinus]